VKWERIARGLECQIKTKKQKVEKGGGKKKDDEGKELGASINPKKFKKNGLKRID